MLNLPTPKTYFWAIFTLALGILVSSGLGCGKKGPRYPEDHARFQKVVQAIHELERAYLNQDATSIHELLLPLDILAVFEANIRQDFAKYSAVDLNLNIDRISIEGNQISSYISWSGEWQHTIGATPNQAEGHGVLLWSGHQVILLRGFEGDLPFGVSKRPDFSS